MTTYEIRLKRRQIVAEGTMVFYLEKPEGFQFKAGQSIDLTLINPAETDAKGDSRPFSLVGAPFETELAVATRMRDSAFKRVLRDLPPESLVRVAGPFGSFTLHNDASRPAVFLAGGIGITPFFSIIKQASHEHRSHRLFLFYSNKRPEEAAFLDELMQLERDNPHYRFIGSMTAMDQSDQAWAGSRERIGPALLEQVLGQIKGPVYYSAGPSDMVAAMRRMLNGAGVDDDDIRTEEFPGY